MQSCLSDCFWHGHSMAWCIASLNYSLVSTSFPLIVLSWAWWGMENWAHLIQNVGAPWSMHHPMGLKMEGSEWVPSSSPWWLFFPGHVCEIYIILRHYQGGAFFLWLMYRIMLQAHSLCLDSPGVPEDCFLGKKNYKAGQSCWLCHSGLVDATLWSLCQGFGWFGVFGGRILKGSISCYGLTAL